MRYKPSFLLHRLLVATYSDVSTSYRTGKHIQMPPTNKNGIPDRWLDYKAVGKKIPGTRFIAFKVPLKQSLNRHVQSSDVFGPKELLTALSKEKQELGLIIDLTYTTRYYKPVDLPDSLFYLKIFTAGHEVPCDPTILSFKRAVRKFLQDNADNEKLIGVHCTHGLNRTGYLVCRYLIDVDGLDPKQAIKLFNSARGHAIERENYLKDLQSGPKRSNQGMDESEQEPIRGQAGSTPPWEREQHGNYNCHRSVPFHQRGMNHQQPRTLHSSLRPPPLLPPPQHHRPRHPPPLIPPSIPGMWSPIPRYQWRPQAQSESAWWRQSPQPDHQYGGSRHENGRGRGFHPQEERRRGPFPPPSAPPYPLLPRYSSEGFRGSGSSSHNPRSEERDEPRRKSQHRHRHHDRT
ncbi:RNA/RNP complex-1-interacting phosphatase isoform X1 [Osmerus eperlanus]|uniref:RNA/RNP complex-1-interacting phosphatase isoform X1 n=2 Tax=Osmerus eperlanus TaxID=29151 RepID=UPI002E14ECFD